MAATKQYQWYKVAESEADLNWQHNQLCEVQVKGKTLCVARTANGLYACAQKCPHAGGYMAAGFTDAAGNIVCPLHRYKFNLQNGRNVSGEGYYLKTYPVELRADGVYIGIEAGNWLSWLG